MKQEYHTQIYHALRAFAFWLPLMILALLILIYIGVAINSPIFGAVGFILICIVPFFFQRRVRRKFTESAILEFDDYGFSIRISKLKNGNNEKKLSYNWDGIKSYKFYFTPSKLTYLDIYLRNQTHKEFGFKDNKSQEECMKGGNVSIFSIFRSYIKNYNSERALHEKIVVKPGFLLTKVGTFYMCLVGFLIIVAIIFIIIHNPKAIPFLFMGIFMFMPFIAKRKIDKDLYNELTRLE
jgi:hypothetical protein